MEPSPFTVGLALQTTDLGPAPPPPSQPAPFMRTIMHRPVSPRIFDAVVLLDASPPLLAAHFSVDEHHVRTVWLRDPPLHAPAPRPPPAPPLLPASLDRDQFGDLLAGDAPALDSDHLELAHALIARLSALQRRREPSPPPVDAPVRRPAGPPRPGECCALPDSGSASSAGMVDSSGCSSAGERRRCGFSERASHVDVEVLCEGLALRKMGGGLYRTARSASRVERGKRVRHVYFEVVVVEDCDAGGICVGVATEELRLNKLVGSNASSVGLHSSGQVVSRGGEFRDFAKGFGKGDRVGCRVSVGGGDMVDGEEGTVELRFWINGVWQGCATERLGEEFAKGRAELFAAVSLYKKASKAVIQCCQKDWAIDMDAVCEGGRVEPICGNSRL